MRDSKRKRLSGTPGEALDTASCPCGCGNNKDGQPLSPHLTGTLVIPNIATALRTVADHLDTRDDDWPTNRMRALANDLDQADADDAERIGLDIERYLQAKDWREPPLPAVYYSDPSTPYRKRQADLGRFVLDLVNAGNQ